MYNVHKHHRPVSVKNDRLLPNEQIFQVSPEDEVVEEEATGVVEDVVDTITRRIEAEEGTQLSTESF